MQSYAGFWQRVRAFAFDYFLIAIYLICITLLFWLMSRFLNLNQWLFTDRVWAQTAAFFIVTLPVTLYFVIQEASPKQATWGKQRLGLKVVDRDGNRISLLRAFARTLLKFIPWEISHTLLWEIAFSTGSFPAFINYGYTLVYLLIGLNIASLVMTKTNQTLYDLLAGAYVLQQPS